MNIINAIRKCLDEEFRELSIDIYSEFEVVINLYEKRVPIQINTATGEIYFEAECYEGKLFKDEMEEICQVLKVIEENMAEIKEWVAV